MDIDSYLELKMYHEKNKQIIKYIFLIIIFILIIFSMYKIKGYKSYELINTDNKSYVLCDKNCQQLMRKNEISIREKTSKFSISECLNGLCEIKLNKKLDLDNTILVGIYEKKESVIKQLFNIFKEKGVI